MQFQVGDSEDGFGKVLIPKGPWHHTFVEVAAEQNISVLRLSHSAGWRGDDLSFLRKMPFLTGIEIYSPEVRDITVLSALSKLRLVGILCDVLHSPNFGEFEHLEVAKVGWRDSISSVLGCSGLKHFNVMDWPDEDLARAASLRRVRRLQITSRRLRSLNGLSDLPALRDLDLDSCPKLESIEHLRESTLLEKLEITSCKRVGDLSALSSLDNLSQLVLDDGGTIESLHPLTPCVNLAEVSFVGSTRIADGRISALESLPHLQRLRFAPRRHYDRSRNEVLNSVGAS